MVDIGIHLTNGKVHWFRQTDLEITKSMLGNLSPNRVLSHSQILIEGIHSTRGINTQFIEVIELIMDPVEEWNNLSGMNITSLTKETFREKIEKLRPVLDKQESDLIKEQLGSIWTFSGKNYHLLIEEKNQPFLDQLRAIQDFFTTGARMIKREDGGYLILNLNNIIRWTLTPGPKNLPADALTASKLE